MPEGLMADAFVDLTYRGLSLGRRIKLTEVRATTGYLETPAPMPVGTTIAIATDDGPALDAVVTQIHEQVAGSEKAPGMVVAPKLEGEAAAWWSARVTAAPAPAPAPVVADPPRAKTPSNQVTVRPRSHTVPAPPPEGAVAEAGEWAGELAKAAAVVASATPEPARTTVMAVPPEAIASPGATMVMNAVDQDLLAELTRSGKSGELEQLTRTTGQHEIVDDGKRTTMMDAVDPAALGLDVSSSGSFPAQDDDSKPAGGGKKKKRKNR